MLTARHSSQKALVSELSSTLTFPIETDGSTLKLKDERILGYKLYGAVGESHRVNKYLVFCHGTPGSRFFMTPSMVDYASEKGVQVRRFLLASSFACLASLIASDFLLSSLHIFSPQVIVVERAGFGLSTFKRDRTILEFASDLGELLDHLEIRESTKVSILGYSAGGPFALGCAKVMPHRVSSVLLVSSLSPPECPKSTSGMSFMNKIAYFIAGTSYWLLKHAVGSEAAATVKNPIKKMQENLATVPGDAQVYMTKPEIERVFVVSALEMYSRPHGAEAEAMDYWLFTHPWGFELPTLDPQVKYHVWYGEEDNSVVPTMGQFLAQQLPGSTVKVVADKGHLLFFDLWKELIDRALE